MNINIEYKLSEDDVKKGLTAYCEECGRKKKNLIYTCIFVALAILNIISFFYSSMEHYNVLVIALLCIVMAVYVFTENGRFIKRCLKNFNFNEPLKACFDDEKIMQAYGTDGELKTIDNIVGSVLRDDMILIITKSGSIFQYMKRDFNDGDFELVSQKIKNRNYYE